MTFKQVCASFYNSGLTDAKLFSAIKSLAKKNIGHGISKEYFEKSLGSNGYLTKEQMPKLVKMAKFSIGCFSSDYMKRKKDTEEK